MLTASTRMCSLLTSLKKCLLFSTKQFLWTTLTDPVFLPMNTITWSCLFLQAPKSHSLEAQVPQSIGTLALPQALTIPPLTEQLLGASTRQTAESITMLLTLLDSTGSLLTTTTEGAQPQQSLPMSSICVTTHLKALRAALE